MQSQYPTARLFEGYLRRGDIVEFERLLPDHPGLLDIHDIVCGDTPLHSLVEYGIQNKCQWAIEHGAGLEVRNKDGMTPLHVAANMDDGDMVDFLLSRGANIEAVDHAGRTPLLYACSMGCEMAAEHLLRAGANADAVDGKGHSMLGCFLSGGPYHDWDQAGAMANLLEARYRDPALVSAANEEAQQIMDTNPRYGAGFRGLVAEIHAAFLQQSSSQVSTTAKRKSRL